MNGRPEEHNALREQGAGSDHTETNCNDTISPDSPWRNIPDELRAADRWVLWEAVQKDNGKTDKKPLGAKDLRPCNAYAPENWSSFEDAVKALHAKPATAVGIGFALGDGWAGVDLDDCIVPGTADMHPEALAVVAELNTYTEVSPSGRGVKMFLHANVDGLVGNKTKDTPWGGWAEIYWSDRFFTVTGDHWEPSPREISACDSELRSVHGRFLPPKAPQTPRAGKPQKRPPTDMTEQELLEVAFRAKNGGEIKRLFEEAGASGNSEGDAALAHHLAFYSGGDPELLERLMRLSARVRDKWDEPRGDETWIGRECREAIARCSDSYEPPRRRREGTAGTAPAPGRASSDLPTSMVLLKMAETEGTCFRDQYGRLFFSAPVNGHLECMQLGRGGPAYSWLLGRYRQEFGKLPHGVAVQEALSGLEAEARTGAQAEVHLRTAQLGDAVYIDLADRERNVVECRPGGVHIVQNPPGVHFVRPPSMGPLPVPDPIGTLSPLWDLLPAAPGVGADDPDPGRILMTAWLIGAFRPAGPYPILCLTGEQGSGKSTVARVLRCCIDPKGNGHVTLLSRPPRKEDDLWIAAHGQRVLAIDNISHLSVDLSDGLAAIATGGAHEVRKLYTDAETALVPACLPIVMTAIGEVAVRGDLLDRSLQVVLPAMVDPVPEKGFWEAVEALRPMVLGGVAKCICAALRHQDCCDQAGLGRMADFHAWILAMEREPGLLPWQPGEFSAVYAANRRHGQMIAADSSPLTAAVVALAQKGFSGTATRLLTALSAGIDPATRGAREWPSTSSRLSSMLTEITPALREMGVVVDRKTVQGSRVIVLSVQPPVQGEPAGCR